MMVGKKKKKRVKVLTRLDEEDDGEAAIRCAALSPPQLKWRQQWEDRAIALDLFTHFRLSLIRVWFGRVRVVRTRARRPGHNFIVSTPICVIQDALEIED